MSLYNMLHGVNPCSRMLLDMLNLTPEDFGRFRDVYIASEDGKQVIRVHTRCGGGNRESYKRVFSEMERHRQYLRDCDDDFDSTYCDFVFSIPRGFEELVKQISEHTDTRPPKERWQQVIEALKNKTPGDPIAEHAMKVGKEILGPILSDMEENPRQ